VEADSGDHAVDESDVVGMHAKPAAGDDVQPRPDLVAGVLDRTAVEVRARTGRGREVLGTLSVLVGASRT